MSKCIERVLLVCGRGALCRNSVDVQLGEVFGGRVLGKELNWSAQMCRRRKNGASDRDRNVEIDK